MGRSRRRAAASSSSSSAAAAAEEDDLGLLGCSFLHELSHEEQLRLRHYHLEHKRKEREYWDRNNSAPRPPMWTEEERDAWLINQVHHALRHYNASHPGGEFDAVKPLMRARVLFRGHPWFHINFWARRRNPTGTGKIKRFFAELHYELLRKDCNPSLPVIERVVIIEEPLDRYKSKTICAFCPPSYDILHPMDGKYLTGKKNLRSRDELLIRRQMPHEMPFTCPLTKRRYQDLRRPSLVQRFHNWAQSVFQLLWALSPLKKRKD
ncbi:hypothetical protein ACP4OV_025522 [Aristida adscensionis]